MRGASATGICTFVLLASACLAAPLASADVVLNEINCEGTDWVELVNTADEPADVSGWLLTDRTLDSTDVTHRYLYPSGTTVGPNDELVVSRDTDGSGPVEGFPFGISCGDDVIRLADDGGLPADEVSVPALVLETDTFGRYPSGTGAWVETIPTSGAPNEPSSATGGPGEDLAAWLFDPHQVVGIDLSLPAESIDALEADPLTYQPGQFTLQTTGATYGPLDVGIRLKGGAGSFQPLTGKAAFKVKINYSVAGQRFAGLKTLTLNNLRQDPSSVHEVLAYEAFRAVDVPAPRTGYAWVEVNGQDYGLYLNVETYDEISLARWYPSTQHLYEGEVGTDVAPGGAGDFEMDEGSEDDRADLESLIAAANAEAPEIWSEQIAEEADLVEMTRMWAVEKYIGHWDGYSGIDASVMPNNFYLHSDSDGRFTMLPWGTDQTWAEHLAFDRPSAILFDRCLADSACAELYRGSVSLARTRIAELPLDAETVQLAGELAPWQALDPRTESTPAEVSQAVAATRAFIAMRGREADVWLSPPLPIGPAETSAVVLAGIVKRKRCKKPTRKSTRAAKCAKRKRRR